MGDRQKVYDALSEGEKVVAGMTYMYWKEGMPSLVSEIRTKVPLEQDLLDLALEDLVARHPYFGVRFEERDGDFYVKKNDAPLRSIRTDELVPLGGHANNYHLMGVTLTDEFLRVSFHHGLTDGHGVMTFVKTLLAYYKDYAEGDDIDAVRSRHAELADELSMYEMKEPFEQKLEVDRGSGKVEGLEKKGYRLAELDHRTTHRRYEMTFAQDEFMSACKKIGATPTVLLSMMMCRGIKAVHPENDKPIISNFPADIRQTIGCPDTYKNCVVSISLPYGEAQESMDNSELASSWRALLKAQTSYDYIAKQANNMYTLMGLLGKVHSYKARQKLLGRMEDLSLDSFIISYIGRLDLPTDLVSELHIYGSQSSGLLIDMSCYDGRFFIDLSQDFESDSYVKALLEQFEHLGIAVTASDAIAFETPRDELAEVIDVSESMRDKIGEKLGRLAEAARKSTRAAKEHEARSMALSREIAAKHAALPYWDAKTGEMKALDSDTDLDEAVETLAQSTPSLFVP